MTHEKVLKNGMRVVTVPMDSSATVSIMVMVRAGSRFETKNISGISHFMEHMFFKGGERYPTAQDVAVALDSIGGEFNAFTGYDKVAYYVKVAAMHQAKGLDVLADMIMNAKVPQEEVDSERNVILEEMNMYEDTPMRRIWELCQTTTFGDHPLGRDIIGTKETLAGINRQELMDFRGEYYRPKNMIIIATGKVDPEEFANQVEKMIPLEGEAGPAEFDVFENHPKERLSLNYKKTEQAQIAITMPGPKLNADDQDATALMCAIFGSGMSSRLFSEIRERQGLCYSIRTNYTPFEDIGLISNIAGVTLDKVDQAITSIFKEMSKIQKDGVEDAELEKGREFVKGHLAIALEDTAEMAEIIGSRTILAGKVDNPEDLIKRFDKITKAQVNAAANKYLSPESAYLTVLGPYKDAERFSKLIL